MPWSSFHGESISKIKQGCYSIFRTTRTNPLPLRHRPRCKNKFAKRFRNMEIGGRRSRGPPCGIKPRFDSSFDAIKSDPPSGCRIEALDEAIHGQRQLRHPGFRGFVQSNAALQTALQVVLFARRDVQIDPKSVRADLEFLITSEPYRIGLKKNFRHIAVPELVAPAVGRRIGKHGDGAIIRVESHKKRLRSPEYPYFRLSFGISILSLPVRVEAQRCGKRPGRLEWESISIGQFGHSNSYSGLFLGQIVVLRHVPDLFPVFSGAPTLGQLTEYTLHADAQ